MAMESMNTRGAFAMHNSPNGFHFFPLCLAKLKVMPSYHKSSRTLGSRQKMKVRAESLYFARGRCRPEPSITKVFYTNRSPTIRSAHRANSRATIILLQQL